MASFDARGVHVVADSLTTEYAERDARPPTQKKARFTAEERQRAIEEDVDVFIPPMSVLYRGFGLSNYLAGYRTPIDLFMALFTVVFNLSLEHTNRAAARVVPTAKAITKRKLRYRLAYRLCMATEVLLNTTMDN